MAEAPKLSHTLTAPIRAHDAEVTVLTFRDPVVADIMAAGLPASLNLGAEPPTLDIDARKMGKMMARLAGVPPSSIQQLAPTDWVACAYMLAGLFVPGATRA